MEPQDCVVESRDRCVETAKEWVRKHRSSEVQESGKQRGGDEETRT